MIKKVLCAVKKRRPDWAEQVITNRADRITRRETIRRFEDEKVRKK